MYNNEFIDNFEKNEKFVNVDEDEKFVEEDYDSDDENFLNFGSRWQYILFKFLSLF